MSELNSIQMHIINELTFKKEAKFSEINTQNISTDHFNYHLQKLQKDGLVEKNSHDQYQLTEKGIKFSSTTDVYNLKIEKQAKIGMIPVCMKEVDGITYYLMHRRKKHPYFDWFGFPSGKAKYGAFFYDEVLRELEEETGLKGKSELKLIKHMHVYKKGTRDLLEDKVFYIFLIEDLSDTLLEKTLEGENFWITKEEMLASQNIFKDNIWIIENIHSPNLLFIEVEEEMESL